MSDTPFDALPPLSALVDAPSLQQICGSASALCGMHVAVYDAAGTLLYHTDPASLTPPEALAKPCQAQTIASPGRILHRVQPLLYEHEPLGRLVLGPYASASPAFDSAALAMGTHLQATFEAIAHASYQRTMTARLHEQSLGRAFADLQTQHAELVRANARLQELDRMKTHFFATVSHELRTPLTSILGYADLLVSHLAGPLTAAQQGHVAIIKQKGDSLLAMINAVLDLASIESGNSTLLRRRTDVQSLVDASVSDVQAQRQERQTLLQVHVAPGLRPIDVDSDKLRRVLAHLLANAIRFTRRGGRVRLDVSSESGPAQLFDASRGESLCFRVQDNGIGIAGEHLERIFEAFFQVDSGETRAYGGSGLGLTIARYVVRAHGGRLDVRSQLGEGSTFVVCLPYDSDLPPISR